jgi:hypothetical protein
MAYPHIKVSEEFQPYLGFEHQGVFYVYVAMPFGARHSPRIFTRALGYALTYIRVHWSVRITAFIDDVLILHQDKEYLELATLQIAVFLQSLEEITYLGWYWSFRRLELRMTREMRKTILSLIAR